MLSDRMLSYLPVTRKAFVIPTLALASVTSKDKTSIYASSDKMYKGAVFGRDSLEVAEDLLHLKPSLVRQIIITLTKLQGLTTNTANEEEPGKIVHEYRRTVLDGKPIDASLLEIFTFWSERLGGTDTELRYYGSIDATPLYLRVLGDYCQDHGQDLLDKQVTRYNGETTTVRAAARGAATWLLRSLENSHSGLLEYLRTNPRGHLNQAWKDSEEFYVHENGEQANHEAPIASIEVQGIAYDAFIAAAQLFPEDQAKFNEQAYRLRDRTIALLWQPNRRYFALGADYSPAGELRVMHTKTANPGALLDSGIFEALPTKEQQHYVASIVETIMSPDFLTSAGIRSRALSASNVVSFWDYHGSNVTWPKETYDIAKGLRRYGLPQLSRQLENRLLNVVYKAFEYPEFVYVDNWGRILTGAPTKRKHNELIITEGINTPERIQAWTVSATYAIIMDRLKSKAKKRPHRRTVHSPKRLTWQIELEKEIMATIPKMNRHLNPILLSMKYPSHKYTLKHKSTYK